MTTPTDFHQLIGYELGQKKVSLNASDAILYAIACGASYRDLDLVYEEQLKGLPGIVSTLGLWAVEKCGDLGVYDRKKSLHVSQGIEIKKSIPFNAEVLMHASVDAVWDRGNATIVDVAVTSEYFKVTYSIFIPGVGGWGGQQPQVPQKQVVNYEESGSYQTSDEQAILYRLTGDLHPVHVDFDVAKAYGFDKPILHGLCTLGIALRLVAGVADKHPAELRRASARLSAPVFPGDKLVLRSAKKDDGYVFEVKVGESVVLKDGFALF